MWHYSPPPHTHTGPEDIYNGNLKLILGLIWTLIRRFQIRSTGRALSTKDAMLAWINTQIPECNIKNFTKDWNDGVALCALVNRIKPGLIPNYMALDRSQKKKNCMKGMTLAEEELKIPSIMDPDDLCHPDVDELSVMTYISYFCNPANTHLLKWVQATIPHRDIKNFTTDWNDGINLAHLLEALNPGGFSNCKSLSPQNALDNLTRCMKAADDQLGIKPVLKPAEMADPSVDELNIVTYLSRFQNAKPLPQPQAITCSGDGLRQATIGKVSVFEVDASKGGSGDLFVEITCNGSPVKSNISSKARNIFTVKYTPTSPGLHTITIKWSNTEVPSSPYTISVLDPNAMTLISPHASGKELARVGEVVKMEIQGMNEVSEVDVTIEFSSRRREQAKIVPIGKGKVECSYTTRNVGIDSVSASIGGIAIPGSPFKVKVVDPKKYAVTLQEPPEGVPLLINGKATIMVSTQSKFFEGVLAELISPDGRAKEIALQQSTTQKDTFISTATPAVIGEHTIKVTCAGEEIKGSPISFQVYDPRKCVMEDVPEVLHIASVFEASLITQGAGEGTAEVKSSAPGVLAAECTCAPGNKNRYVVKLTPKKVGSSTLSVEWNGNPIPQPPQKVSVCDATQCSAFGPGLTSGKGKIKELFEFTVQVKGGGDGQLSVTAKGPKTVYLGEVSRKSEDAYTVSFTTFELGKHSIDIQWSGRPIPRSPYSVLFEKVADAKTFVATGDGLKTSIACNPASFVVVGPEPGLITSGILKMSISGQGFESVMANTETEFDPKDGTAKMLVKDNGNGSYAAQYAVPKPGTYTLSITSDGENIPGSPFKVNILPSPDAAKCKAFGSAMDNPLALIVSKPLEFKVDSTDAGTGELTVTATDPNSANCPVFLAKSSAGTGKRIQAIKVDPKISGKYTVNVQWSGKPIPKSPFTFDISDPKAVTIVDLPDSSDYIARKEEPIVFTVDASKAGVGELKCAAKLDTGKIEVFDQKKNADGTTTLSYKPKAEGKLELLLTYCGVSVLPIPWVTEVTDPMAFKVIPPSGYGKQGEYVRFIITGITGKKAKNIHVTAKNKTHDATVKMEINDQGQANARFTAKELGEYKVEVKVAKKHISGSPFQCLVANPNKCVVAKGNSVPAVIPVGVEKQFTVDTSTAGPGDLTSESTGSDGRPSSCTFTTISGSNGEKVVRVVGKVCGKCSFQLKYAGFPIPSMPVEVIVVDPAKCTFTCKDIRDGVCKTTDTLVAEVNTSQGGSCTPKITVKGPKSEYDAEVKRILEGEFTASFTAWQDGANSLQVTVGGVDISGSPLKFEALKPLDTSKVTATGSGLKEAIANRRAEVTVFARESMLIERGLLNIGFENIEKMECDLEVYDKQNGTYSVSFTPKTTGTLTLNIMGEGKMIAGSPFNIDVKPEPDPSKCKITNRSGDLVFQDSSEIYHLLKIPFELGINTASAGSGKLTASCSSPNKSQVGIFTNDQKVKGESVTYIKFDPTSVGIHTLSLKWDNQELPGSPYSIKVVNPTSCKPSDPLPSCLRVGDIVKCKYKCDPSVVGEGEIKVFSKGAEITADVTQEEGDVSTISLTGVAVGSTAVDIKYGDFSLPGSPYAISVCDPAKCSIVGFSPGRHNVMSPINFTVSAEGAGRAKLQVVSSMSSSHTIRNPQDNQWDVSFTPKEVGNYSLQIFWGDWEIEGSPVTFQVCDPKQVKVEGLPDPNNVLLMGEVVTFTVDTLEAGNGEIVCRTLTNDDNEEEVDIEETDTDTAISSLSFIPKNPGKVQIILEYNGVDILTRPHIYQVPDPSQFCVTPPKGWGKVNEHVKFSITGVSEGTSLDISVVHLTEDEEESVEVITEHSSQASGVMAHFTPEVIGDYKVSVKHANKDIDGSPFSVPVCNPESCKIIGKVPSVIHVGEKPDIQVDPSEAGPGKLTFETEAIEGMEDVTAQSDEEDETQWHMSLTEGVGKVRLSILWSGYPIPGSPFILTIVDSQKVTWSCDALKEGTVSQGEIVKINVDGSEGGDTLPEVLAVGPETEEYPAKISDHQDQTYTITITPWQVGENKVDILWGGRSITDMPVTFNVIKNIEARAISVSGEGLTTAVAEYEALVIINAIEAGLVEKDLLSVSFANEASEGDVPLFDLTDEGNGVYELHYFPLLEGKCSLSIKYEGQHINNSPFDITVKRAPDASECVIFGEAVERDPPLFIANNPIKFSVDTSNAGYSSLNISATQPDEEPIRVYTVEEGDLHHLKFDPILVGHYHVDLTWGEEEVPGGPFDFNVVDPRKCVVKGLPQDGTQIQKEEEISFNVLMKEVGDAVPVVTFEPSQGEPITIEASEESEDVYSYHYTPESDGKCSISVKVADCHVSKSPFNFIVADPSQFTITGNNLSGEYAIVCEPVSTQIQGMDHSGDNSLVVTAHGPSADLSVEVKEVKEGTYDATFIPIEPGSYEVFIEHAGQHVTGSPFTLKVADPSKCQVLGDVLSLLQFGESDEMTIKTRGAGEGELKALVKFEDHSAPTVQYEVKNLGLDTYSMVLKGERIGKATVDLQWAGFTIPNSPFLIQVCDASKCKVTGDVLTSKKGKAGTAINFTVETEGAGEGKLEVTAVGPSAKYTMNIDEIKESTYNVSFTPWEIGEHKITVLWGKTNAPKSPFTIAVGSPLEMEVCNATGEGLKHGIAGQKSTFTIICSEMGLLDKNVLSVTVMGVSSHAEVQITDNNNGCYKVDYVPKISGAYVATILFHGRQIPGSPFKITVDSGPDASKCKAYGPALHPNALAIAGSPLEFFVDTTEAGYGQLKVYVQGPRDYRPKVFMANDEKGVYSIKFDAMKAGKYFAAVVWADKHIPNSPFRIRVHPAANAGKVKAFGPGLLDGFLGTPGQFTIETKDAGIGTMLIRIHGLKDSFKIEAKPLSEADTRTLIVTYSPKLVGQYVIFVRWSGVHVPGSPFTVNIKQKPGTLTLKEHSHEVINMFALLPYRHFYCSGQASFKSG